MSTLIQERRTAMSHGPHWQTWRARATSSEYRAWNSMLARCLNPKHKMYAPYGGRGISVCARWIGSFENFFWDMGPRAPGMTLERNNVNGHYEPENCRWATPLEQARNRTDSKLIEWRGQTFSLAEWAERLGIPYQRLFYRVKSGWTIEEAFTSGYQMGTPPGSKTAEWKAKLAARRPSRSRSLP